MIARLVQAQGRVRFFLDLDTTSFADLGKLKPMSQLAEENAILKARLWALGQGVED